MCDHSLSSVCVQPVSNSSNGQVRVKFELGEEKAIVMMVRPLTLNDIWEYVLKRFGNRYNLYYYSSEVRYWCVGHAVM